MIRKIVLLVCLFFVPFQGIAEENLSLTLSDTFQSPQSEISKAFALDVSKGGSNKKDRPNFDRDPQKFFEDDVLRSAKHNPMDSPLMPQQDKGRFSKGYGYASRHNHFGK